MKKIGILLAILLVAGVCAMADEAVIVQDDLLFADIDAVAMSQVEMEAVDGGQYPGDCASGDDWKAAKKDRTKAAVKDIVKGGAKGAIEAVKLLKGGWLDWTIDKAGEAIDRW